MQHKGEHSMSEQETTTVEKKNPTDGRSGNARRKSFRLDEDTLIGCWAEHNNEYKGCENTYDEEAKFQAYSEFCYKVFSALTDTKIAKQYANGSAPNRIRDFPDRLKGVLDNDTSVEQKKDVIFNFMWERLSRKCDDLLPELKRYNSAIQVPFGQEWAGWMWSEERKWQGRASQFDKVHAE